MVIYRIAVVLVRIWLKLCGCRIYGREHIPADGACLLIANHISYGDPVLLAAAFPRHITFIAKQAFGTRRITRVLYGNLAGAVFLNQDESDLSALRTSIRLLKEGRTVGIFPEGRRNFDRQMTDFMPGAAYIAHKAGVPVLPVALSNSHNMLRFWKRDMVVRIGAPLLPPQPAPKATQEYLQQQSHSYFAAVQALYQQNGSELAQRGKTLR